MRQPKQIRNEPSEAFSRSVPESEKSNHSMLFQKLSRSQSILPSNNFVKLRLVKELGRLEAE